jgi:hypothetical protein
MVDLVREENQANWVKIIKKEAHILRPHGYFVTRLSGPREQGSWESSRIRESQFFQTTRPWCELDQSVMGTGNLTRALGDKLSAMIMERFALIAKFQLTLSVRLPSLGSALSGCKQKFQDELKKLPEVGDDPQTKIANMCNGYTQRLNEHFHIKAKYRDFWKELMRCFKELKREIEKTEPLWHFERTPEGEMGKSPFPQTLYC